MVGYAGSPMCIAHDADMTLTWSKDKVTGDDRQPPSGAIFEKCRYGALY